MFYPIGQKTELGAAQDFPSGIPDAFLIVTIEYLSSLENQSTLVDYQKPNDYPAQNWTLMPSERQIKSSTETFMPLTGQPSRLTS
jgi:hypothetical protein